jgi:hypothetical protein
MRCSILEDAWHGQRKERFWFSENGQWMQKTRISDHAETTPDVGWQRCLIGFRWTLWWQESARATKDSA